MVRGPDAGELRAASRRARAEKLAREAAAAAAAEALAAALAARRAEAAALAAAEAEAARKATEVVAAPVVTTPSDVDAETTAALLADGKPDVPGGVGER